MLVFFRPFTLADVPAWVQASAHSGCRGALFNPANLLSYASVLRPQTAMVAGDLVVWLDMPGFASYVVPSHHGSWRPLLDELRRDASDKGNPLRLYPLVEESARQIEAECPGRFSMSYERSVSEYVYTRASLASLSGQALQSKRAHCHRFERLFPEWQFSALGPDDFDACLALDHKWRRRVETEGKAAASQAEELRSMNYVFAHWGELGMSGGVLRAGETLVAFTYGAPVGADTFDTCVEKADRDYPGAFAMVNREMARSLPENLLYVNREEDLGIEGLRRAKLSYHPLFLNHRYELLEKHTA